VVLDPVSLLIGEGIAVIGNLVQDNVESFLRPILANTIMDVMNEADRMAVT
jgi:hypothetical protein